MFSLILIIQIWIYLCFCLASEVSIIVKFFLQNKHQSVWDKPTASTIAYNPKYAQQTSYVQRKLKQMCTEAPLSL